MNKIIIVCYVHVGNMVGQDVDNLMAKIGIMLKEREETEGILHYLIPIYSGSSRIECINPKLLTEDEYAHTKVVLDNAQAAFKDLMERHRLHNDEQFEETK